jgi:phage gp29-like protein
MTPLTDPDILTQLLTAINSDGYGSERIDRIISAASVPAPGYEGEDTIVIAQSGIKQLVFLMNDTRPAGQTFQSRILNPDDLKDDANFAEYEMEPANAEWMTDPLSEAIVRTAKLLTTGEFSEKPTPDDRDDLDIIADRVRTADPVRPWIEQLAAGLDGVKDLSEFAEYLTDSWDKLESNEFRDRMSQAMTIAAMAGYLEAGTDAV